MTTIAEPAVQFQSPSTCDPTLAVTRSLLGYGIIAGPIYLTAVAVQEFTRDGFDPIRLPASMLALGPHGWVQTALFAVTGLMVLLAAAGIHRCLGSGLASNRVGRWAARLTGVYGAAMIAASALPLDPGMGFPQGTPAGPGQLSWHGIGHLVAGGIGFPAVGVAMTLVGAVAARAGRHAMARFCRVAAGVYAVLYVISVAQLGGPVNTLVFDAAVVTAFGWLTVACTHLYRRPRFAIDQH